MTSPRPPIRALLLDVSGTLHVGSSATPGAVEALSHLRRSKISNPGLSTCKDARLRQSIPFRFCSNTSKEGRKELAERLLGLGFEIKIDERGRGREIWTSLGATSSLMRKQGLRRPFCFLEHSSKDEILKDIETSPSEDAEYDCVVLGLAPSMFTYEHLNTAFRILLSTPPKPLIATHRAKYIRTQSSTDSLSLGPGPFVAALEAATGVQAEVVGKPSRTFFEMVIDDFAEDELLPEGRIAIVGDDVETDLGGGAVELGLWRVLVRTGKYRPGDEHRPGVVPPDEVCDSFAAFLNSLMNSS